MTAFIHSRQLTWKRYLSLAGSRAIVTRVQCMTGGNRLSRHRDQGTQTIGWLPQCSCQSSSEQEYIHWSYTCTCTSTTNVTIAFRGWSLINPTNVTHLYDTVLWVVGETGGVWLATLGVCQHQEVNTGFRFLTLAHSTIYSTTNTLSQFRCDDNSRVNAQFLKPSQQDNSVIW